MDSLQCVAFIPMHLLTVAGNVMLTSTVEVNGRQFACDGEMVTFNCQVVRSLTLQWHSPLIPQNPIVFQANFIAPRSDLRPPFNATLTSIAGMGPNTNFTSTMQVNASRTNFRGSDTTLECRNQRQVTEESIFTVAGNSEQHQYTGK